MNVAQALAAAHALGLARLDAQLLLLHVLQRASHERAWLIAHDDALLRPVQEAAFLNACERRRIGEPVAYLVGHKEFHGLSLKVDRRVLVPRPDTETLVDWALAVLEPLRSPRVIDLGTGSGAIALAIKHKRPDAQVEAVDASEDALDVARSNASALGLEVQMRRASWLEGAGCYDLIVSNPPYVAEDDPHLEQLANEPRSALAAGADGLDDLKVIIRDAPQHLQPGGWLLLEHGWDQAPRVRALLLAAGFQDVASRRDLADIERASGGRRVELG